MKDAGSALRVREAVAFGYIIDLGEACRRLFGHQRRMLAFVEERKDKLVLEDKRLLFATEQEAAAINGLPALAAAAAAEVTRINDEQVRKDDAYFKNGGGMPAPPKPE